MATDYYELLAQEDVDWGVDAVTKRNPGGGTLSATRVGIHSLAEGQAAATKSWTPGAISAGSATTTTITVEGAVVGDFVLGSFDQMGAGANPPVGYVSAVDTVTVVISAYSAVTLSQGTLRVLVFKSR